jgi:hypothetical protein
MFATLDMTMLAGLAFDTNGRFIGLRAPHTTHVRRCSKSGAHGAAPQASLKPEPAPHLPWLWRRTGTGRGVRRKERLRVMWKSRLCLEASFPSGTGVPPAAPAQACRLVVVVVCGHELAALWWWWCAAMS